MFFHVGENLSPRLLDVEMMIRHYLSRAVQNSDNGSVGRQVSRSLYQLQPATSSSI